MTIGDAAALVGVLVGVGGGLLHIADKASRVLQAVERIEKRVGTNGTDGIFQLKVDAKRDHEECSGRIERLRVIAGAHREEIEQTKDRVLVLETKEG